MMREVLAIGGGIVVGVAICYCGYRIYKYYSANSNKSEEDIFDKKLKEKEYHAKKMNDLLSNQVYFELLTAKDLTAWFKENRGKMPENAKMVIVTPTYENMKGLGYLGENDLDVETNVVQVFYDDESGEVYKIRLVNFTDIESNLQAQLIENEGMIVVTA